jgi:S-adenosylmethionine:tRNA ribosyltransferase-isomerase
MHREWIEIARDTVEDLLKQIPRPVIAVGTTSLRSIESLYWMGVKAIINPDATIDQLEVQQWDAYDLPQQDVTAEEALQALLQWMWRNQLKQLVCHTQILIAPGYKTRIASAIITNFHQPNSTLLLLVAALIGDHWKQVYAHAMENNFRFLSYGDGSLLWANVSR